jgi:hypothetical protein
VIAKRQDLVYGGRDRTQETPSKVNPR